MPLFALAVFFGAYFFFYRGTYDPPPVSAIPFESITPPVSELSTFTDRPQQHPGTLLMDGTHRNDFEKAEVSTLLTRVSDRGHAIEFIGVSSVFGGFRSLDVGERTSLLEEKLRQADSYAVILPDDPYSRQEVDLVERFVRKGGRLLLIADPTRNHQINSLAEQFGVSFQPDYLYNTVEYDLNFQNIFIKSFRPDALTQGLNSVAFYTAGSVMSPSAGLALADENTRSSIVERVEPFYPMAKSADGQVLAIADLTFMVPPRNSILDNDRLISNIADYLTTGSRRFDLKDFPYFLGSEVDILIGRSSLFDVGASLKSLLSDFQIDSEVRGVEDITEDTVYLGLYEDSSDVAQYLGLAGIQIDGALRTPFTRAIERGGTGLVLLSAGQDRHVLVVLADSEDSLGSIVSQLRSGDFRDGLVADFVGVYRTP